MYGVTILSLAISFQYCRKVERRSVMRLKDSALLPHLEDARYDRDVVHEYLVFTHVCEYENILILHPQGLYSAFPMWELLYENVFVRFSFHIGVEVLHQLLVHIEVMSDMLENIIVIVEASGLQMAELHQT